MCACTNVQFVNDYVEMKVIADSYNTNVNIIE